MGAKSGTALRGLQFFLRTIQFCCAALVLAIFSYFLATLHNHDMNIGTWIRAVEGISGAAVAYTILAFLFLCCAPGQPVLSFLMMVLDVAFAGAFIYVAVANRDGAGSCDGEVNTAFGKGNADTNVVDNGNGGFTALPSLRQACQMETACLAVSIVAIFFFLFSTFVNLALVRHRRKEQRFGPSPANDYTSGYSKKRFSFFGRRRKPEQDVAGATQDPNALPAHSTPDDVRNSYATEQTRVGSGYGGLGSGQGKYEPYAQAPAGGQNIPMGRYPNSNGNAGYRHDYNDGVYDTVELNDRQRTNF